MLPNIYNSKIVNDLASHRNELINGINSSFKDTRKNYEVKNIKGNLKKDYRKLSKDLNLNNRSSFNANREDLVNEKSASTEKISQIDFSSKHLLVNGNTSSHNMENDLGKIGETNRNYSKPINFKLNSYTKLFEVKMNNNLNCMMQNNSESKTIGTKNNFGGNDDLTKQTNLNINNVMDRNVNPNRQTKNCNNIPNVKEEFTNTNEFAKVSSCNNSNNNNHSKTKIIGQSIYLKSIDYNTIIDNQRKSSINNNSNNNMRKSFNLDSNNQVSSLSSSTNKFYSGNGNSQIKVKINTPLIKSNKIFPNKIEEKEDSNENFTQSNERKPSKCGVVEDNNNNNIENNPMNAEISEFSPIFREVNKDVKSTNNVIKNKINNDTREINLHSSSTIDVHNKKKEANLKNVVNGIYNWKTKGINTLDTIDLNNSSNTKKKPHDVTSSFNQTQNNKIENISQMQNLGVYSSFNKKRKLFDDATTLNANSSNLKSTFQTINNTHASLRNYSKEENNFNIQSEAKFNLTMYKNTEKTQNEDKEGNSREPLDLLVKTTMNFKNKNPIQNIQNKSPNNDGKDNLEIRHNTKEKSKFQQIDNMTNINGEEKQNVKQHNSISLPHSNLPNKNANNNNKSKKINFNDEKSILEFINSLDNIKIDKKFHFMSSLYSNKNYGKISCFGYNTHNGTNRNYNEDRISIHLYIKKPPEYKGQLPWPDIHYFAVLDGHGGSKCVDFLKEKLVNYIVTNKYFPENVDKAINEAITNIETFFLENYASNPNKTSILDLSGSCVIFLLVINEELYVINIGDSRALLVKNGFKDTQAITTDHKPENSGEYKRITENGGDTFK